MFSEKKKPQKNRVKPAETDPAIEKAMKTPEFESYIENLRLFTQSDLVIIVLDARNPFSCRYTPYEDLLGDKILFVINKIDLVPRESVYGWNMAFNNISKTISISAAHNTEQLLTYIREKSDSKRIFKICITGLINMGKKTIEEHIKQLNNVSVTRTKDWIWMTPTPDLIAMGSFPLSTVSGNIIACARDLFSRCTIQSLMDVFSFSFSTDSENVFNSIDRNKRTAAIELFRRLSDGRIKFYSVPPSMFLTDLGPLNSDPYLKVSPLYDQFCDGIIALGSSTPNSVIRSLIPVLHSLAAKKEKKQNP